MHFIAIWTFAPEHAAAATQRFMETGAPPPDGVTMLARWHDVSGRRGFALARTDDAAAMAKWTRQWHDLLSFEVIPVVDDDQIAAVLGAG
jgi:hypothetical protein